MEGKIHQYSDLSSAQCQQARLARDARFDGLFFIAVKTTGIFCRPICPASPPKEQNVEYFSNQAQALQAGYRPCLRCRPDSAPFSPAWKGVETTFLRAQKLIEEGGLAEGSSAALCARLGISDRYLRSLFSKYMGVSPKQYAIYNQLMFAKQLLHNSQMSITDIGFACGFNSTRRFNDAFVKVMKLSPSQIRKSGSDNATTNTVRLPIKGSINWSHMLNFYRKRMIEGVEEVGEDYYQRTVTINGATGWFRIRCDKNSKQAGSALEVEFELSQMNQLRNLIRHIRRMFDLDVDINRVEAHLYNVDSTLIKEPGIRIPGVWSPWEAGVRAILGQQVSVKAAIGQLNLLATQLSPKEGTLYFPTPEQVSQADISFLRMPQSRKDTLHRFAAYMVENQHQHPSKWLDLKGIGPWTVQYALLRGLSEPDHLLTGDLIVKKFIDQHANITANKVSPWGSYATFHCWSHF